LPLFCVWAATKSEKIYNPDQRSAVCVALAS